MNRKFYCTKILFFLFCSLISISPDAAETEPAPQDTLPAEGAPRVSFLSSKLVDTLTDTLLSKLWDWSISLPAKEILTLSNTPQTQVLLDHVSSRIHNPQTHSFVSQITHHLKSLGLTLAVSTLVAWALTPEGTAIIKEHLGHLGQAGRKIAQFLRDLNNHGSVTAHKVMHALEEATQEAKTYLGLRKLWDDPSTT